MTLSRNVTPLLLAVLLPLACSSSPGASASRGAVMVALSTDLVVGKDIDRVDVSVTHHGTKQFESTFPLALDPAHAKDLPQTFAVSAGVGDADPVTIVVTAFRGAVPRIERRAVVSVPDQRTALLRMPLQWLCDGSAPGAAVPRGAPLPCAEGTTCIAGRCVPPEVDVATLADFVKDDVFARDACFDAAGCFPPAATPPVKPLSPFAGCLVAAGAADKNGLIVELPLGSDGVCDDTHCLVVLEEDSTFGVHLTGGRLQTGAMTNEPALQVPPALCTRLDAAAPGTLALYRSPDCVSKTAKTSDCAPKPPPPKGDDLAPLASDPRCLAVDSNNVYFATADTLSSVPKAGGATKVLAGGRTTIGACVTDGVNLYFTDGSALLAVPVGGGTVTPFGVLGGSMARLALTSDRVLASVEDASPSVLRSFQKSDGTATVLFTAAAQADAGAAGRLQGLTTDGPDVYVAHVLASSFQLLRMPASGGAPVVVAGGPVTTPVTTLAVDATYLYGSGGPLAGFANFIGKVRKDASAALPEFFVSNLPDPPAGRDRALLVSKNALLFDSGATVESYDAAAGARTTLVSAAAAIALFAVDDAYVYLATVNPPRLARAKR
jgi:hypothetical protein